MSAAFVAAIGASAGGLEALSALVSRLPAGTGGAFVIAQHVSPAHRSLLGDLLGRRAALAVRALGPDPAPPEADVVHVVPAGADVVLEGGRLRLAPAGAAPGVARPSIDRLSMSVAAEAGPRGVAIVLSGTGSDGAAGLRAIHDAGGLTIVQAPESAKCPAMPEAALRTGCVDLVLPPDEIGALFARAVGRDWSPERLRAASATGSDATARLVGALRAAFGIDFAQYKPAMVRRRVARRMEVAGCADPDRYAALAADDPEELAALRDALLIPVTSFFRDREEFDALGPELARLLETDPCAPLTVWIPGCASGEEVWTLAALLADLAGGEAAFAARDIRLLGTDVDMRALGRAAAARYSAEAVAAAPAALGRFFETRDGVATPRAALRAAASFRRHDVLSAPPVTGAGLVSCRNVLIYLTDRAQGAALGAIARALRPDGALFLGRAESVAALPGAFVDVDGHPRILRPAPVAQASALPRPAARPPRRAGPAAPVAELFATAAVAFGEPAVIVDPALRVLRWFGETAALLGPSAPAVGAPLDAALAPRWRREGPEIARAALAAGAARQGVPRVAALAGARLACEALEAAPLPRGARGEAGAALLRLRRWREAPRAAPLAPAVAPTGSVAALADALRTANEELQATAQELQTANEELQAANEELTTLNEQLELRSQQLAETAAHLGAVLAHIASPVLVVDRRLRLSDASNAARALFGLTEATLAARPDFAELPAPPGFPPLAPLFREALAQGEPATRQIDGPTSAWAIRVAPFREGDGAIGGAVAVLADETERRAREARLREAMEKLAASNAELERFSYVASHDLKEPVRTLGGFAECLADPDLALTDAERAALLASISQNARRLGEIVDSLLAFSRIDRELRYEPVDLGEAAREAAEFLARAARDAQALVEIGPLPTVRASRAHMRQLFQNLIGNAIKFRRGPRCRVRVSAARAGAAQVVSVEDDGPGVPEEAREVIFEVFRRLHPREEIDGTGLGLSICRKIVEQYGGRIWCESSALGGAAFRVALPAR